MKKEIDCFCTKEIVCPHCGYEFSDSYEVFRDGDEWVEGLECEECGKEFNVGVEYTVDYSSYKPKEK